MINLEFLYRVKYLFAEEKILVLKSYGEESIPMVVPELVTLGNMSLKYSRVASGKWFINEGGKNGNLGVHVPLKNNT